MTLEAAYFIAQIIAAAAVVGSLIFVGLQVRANTAEQRLSRLRERGGRVGDLMTDLMHDSELRSIFIRGSESYKTLSPEDALAFGSFIAKHSQTLMEVAAHRQAKGIGDSQWQGFLRFARALGERPGVQEWWEENKAIYGSDASARLKDMLFGDEAPAGHS